MNADFRKFTKKLRVNGYELDHVSGSHFIYKDKRGHTLSVNKDPNRMMMRRLVKENKLR